MWTPGERLSPHLPWLCLGGIVVLILLRFFFTYWKNRLQESIGTERAAEQRMELGNVLKRVSLGYFAKNDLGDILAALTTELSTLELQSMKMVDAVVNGYIQVAVILLCVAFFCPPAALAALIGVLVSAFALRGIGRQSARTAPVSHRAQEALSGAAIEYIHGLPVVKSFGQDGVSVQRFREACRANKAIRIKNEFGFVPWNCLHLFALRAASVGLVLTAGWQALAGALPLQYFLMIALFSFTIFGSVEAINDAAHILSVTDSVLDRLEELLEGDLLQLVLPEGVKASGKRAGAEDILADLRKGKAEEEAESNGSAEQLLVNEYILLYFDSFLKACEGREALTDQTLDYEQEYLLCGKRSDRENLAQTAEKLLMIRAAMNLLYLLSAPDKKAQADSLAAAVSGGNAAVGLIIGFLVLSLWALGEAVWDVRGLLDGGRTEFWKTDRTWHLSLEGLLAMEFLEGRTDMEASGSGYEDYIRLLLFLEDKTERNYRMMDVIQWNVRKKQKDFTAGSCACRVEIRTEVSQKHVFLIKNEYGQTVETAWTY